jgi:hypothetical protein
VLFSPVLYGWIRICVVELLLLSPQHTYACTGLDETDSEDIGKCTDFLPCKQPKAEEKLKAPS